MSDEQNDTIKRWFVEESSYKIRGDERTHSICYLETSFDFDGFPVFDHMFHVIRVCICPFFQTLFHRLWSAPRKKSRLRSNQA